MGIGISLLLSLFILFYFPLEYNCFTKLRSLLLCNSENQLCVCVCVYMSLYIHIHIAPFLGLPPTSPHLIPAIQVITEHFAELPVPTAAPFELSALYIAAYVCQLYSCNVSHPSLLACVHLYILRICVCIPALQISSTAPFL